MANKNGKIIAVWGSPGSGKTSLAVRMTTAFSEEGKQVMLVCSDITAPDMPVLIPNKELATMGGLWNNLNCNSELILKSCVVTGLKNIGILGYKAGENVFSHSDYTKENVFKVYNELENMADYVIVDCVSYFAYNMLSAVALEAADIVVRIGEATLKSFSFFDSNLPLLADGRYGKDEHIRILAKTKSFQARELAKSRLGSEIEIPYSGELELMMLEGRMFRKKMEDDAYTDGIHRILCKIEGMNENE